MHVADVLDHVTITHEGLSTEKRKGNELSIARFFGRLGIKTAQVDIAFKVKRMVVLVVPRRSNEIGKAFVHFGRRGKRADRLEAGLRSRKEVRERGCRSGSIFNATRSRLAQVKVVFAFLLHAKTRANRFFGYIEIRHIRGKGGKGQTGGGQHHGASKNEPSANFLHAYLLFFLFSQCENNLIFPFYIVIYDKWKATVTIDTAKKTFFFGVVNKNLPNYM